MELDDCASVIYRAKDDDVACRVSCKDLSKSCVFKEMLNSEIKWLHAIEKFNALTTKISKIQLDGYYR